MRAAIAVVLCVCIGGAGCMSKLEDQGKATGSTVLNKKTQDVTKFDPNANEKVSDSKVKVDASFGPLAPMQAYGPLMEQVSNIAVDQAVALFQAEHDRFPKDYNEFMKEIIKKNNIELPVLPGGRKYQYNEKTHKLVIVIPNPPPDGKAQPSGSKSTTDLATPTSGPGY